MTAPISVAASFEPVLAAWGIGAEGGIRYANEYAGVWWARAENRTVLVGSLAGLNVHLQPNMPEEADQERALAAS